MPIANCLINPKLAVTNTVADKIAETWAADINVDINDICLTFIENKARGGRKYDIVVNLFLPSLWDQDSVDLIQKCLMHQLCSHLQTEPDRIIIITSIVDPGNVIDDGQIVKW